MNEPSRYCIKANQDSAVFGPTNPFGFSGSNRASHFFSFLNRARELKIQRNIPNQFFPLDNT